MNNTNVKVEFVILGDFSPDDITDKLIIMPTFTWRAGDKINPSKHDRVYKYSGWEISTEYEESLDINEQLNQVLTKIKDRREILAEICKKEGGIESRFCIVIKIEKGQTPAMTLNRKLIEFACAINAEFEFDVYANPYSDME